MKRYLLDTNILIHSFRNQFKVAEKIKEVGLNNCYISELTLAELKVGLEVSRQKGYPLNKKVQNFLEVANVIDISNAINYFASESARLRLAGTPVHNGFDLMIGCSSVVNNMIMVTENLKDFQNINGIEIQNWVKRF